MMGQETREVERKVIAILRVLKDSPEPLGGRVIARQLDKLGIGLGERAVRYHLKLMDARGLTQPAGRKDGRTITPSGLDELGSALVTDRVGAVTAKIQALVYQTSFDPQRGEGNVPVNLSIFSRNDFRGALRIMKGVSGSELPICELVAVAQEGEKLGEIIIPPGKVGLATVSSVLLCGVLLKAGIAPESKFGGVLQIRNHKPLRFTDYIEYSGSSLDPAEVFIASQMTSVVRVAREQSGKILASFWELPALARAEVTKVADQLDAVGIRNVVALGKPGEVVCELPVAPNRIGMVMSDGLNLVAAAVEASIKIENHAMFGVIDSGRLRNFCDLSSDKR